MTPVENCLWCGEPIIGGVPVPGGRQADDDYRIAHIHDVCLLAAPAELRKFVSACSTPKRRPVSRWGKILDWLQLHFGWGVSADDEDE